MKRKKEKNKIQFVVQLYLIFICSISHFLYWNHDVLPTHLFCKFSIQWIREVNYLMHRGRDLFEILLVGYLFFHLKLVLFCILLHTIKLWHVIFIMGLMVDLFWDGFLSLSSYDSYLFHLFSTFVSVSIL